MAVRRKVSAYALNTRKGSTFTVCTNPSASKVEVGQFVDIEVRSTKEVALGTVVRVSTLVNAYYVEII